MLYFLTYYLVSDGQYAILINYGIIRLNDRSDSYFVSHPLRDILLSNIIVVRQ